MTLTIVLIVVIVAILGVSYWWRYHSLACPANLSWLVDNTMMDAMAGPDKLFSRMQLKKGMKFLDVGCGPGRLTIPAAQWVGDSGEVVALDLQEKMLTKLRARLDTTALQNVRLIHAGAGQGAVEDKDFDRALMVTVLGEIKDKPAALTEVYNALKPGGVLSITEMVTDPHYQSRTKIKKLAANAGFEVQGEFGNWFVFTINLHKPLETADA